MKKNTLTIYCASSATLAPVYTEAAAALGRAAALAGADIVTGGGYTGLMGAVADAALAAGGKVTGIIPRFMEERGWHHRGLSELRIVDGMHSRKELMASLATAAIALPGGVGTFEELMEIITWRQLGLFSGNVVIFNVNGYYDPLLAMMDRAIAEGFMRPDHRSIFTVATSVEETLAAAFAEPEAKEWSPKF
ncbi:MAG: TIGR00730 family Rossman fold protein [Muribaculaceae bacterium]|nr:TIGR00730 family Rossman fold protein [Muribaculaceae bacterium]